MTAQAIKVEELAKSYGKTQVVKGISFTVEKGEIFGFLGPNGAGKTTSIRMMIGEISHDHGFIEILGYRIPDDSAQIKNLVGVVPDCQNLYDRISVRQNLEFFASLNSLDHSRIDIVLSEVFLSEHQHKACKDLSRGLRQRALIARALLHQPQVLFLDEPTSALDPHSAKMIRDLVLSLKNKGTTVFLTTHYMEEADSLCDRLAIMNLGNIVACEKPENLKKRFGRPSAILEYISSGQLLKKEFTLTNDSDRNSLAEMIRSHETVKLHTQEASLEEVFMRVTGNQWKADGEE